MQICKVISFPCVAKITQEPRFFLWEPPFSGKESQPAQTRGRSGAVRVRLSWFHVHHLEETGCWPCSQAVVAEATGHFCPELPVAPAGIR